MSTYYLKNLTGSSIIVNDLGIELPGNSEIPIDSNNINGWLTGDLTTELQASNLTLSTTDISDSSGDMTSAEAIQALTITSEYDKDNPHTVTFTQTVTADPNTDVTALEIEQLTNGSDVTTPGLHTHDGRYYTITQISNSNPTTVDVHWDNIIDAPAFGSFEWRAPVICRVEGQFASAPAGSEGQYYVDTTDQHLYRYDGTSWVDQGVPSAVEDDETRFIDKSNQNIYQYNGTDYTEIIPADGWSLLLEDDGDGNPAQYIYTDISGTLKWTKIADIDWGTHNQIGGRSDSGAHPALAINYNNTLTSWNFNSITVQEAIDEVNDLISQAGEEVWVDNSRTDSYVETGSMQKPFKTISSAVAYLGNGGIIHIGPGIYTENFILPGNFSIQGSGSDNTILEGDFTLGDGTPRGRGALEDLSLKGEMTVDLSTGYSCEIDRCQSTGTLVISSGGVFADSFSILPSVSGATAVTVNNQAFFTNENANIISTGDVPTIISTGVLTFTTCNVEGTTTNVPVIDSNGGRIRMSFCSLVNNGTNISMDIQNDATTADPNMLQGVSHNAGIDLHASVTVLEGIYGPLPNGTAIIFRPARQIAYDNSSSGLDSTNVQDAIDELAFETGVNFDGIVFVAKNGTDTGSFEIGTMDNPYLTVQAAINAAQAAGGYQIVFVAPGLYEESVTVPAYVALYSYGKEPTRIGTGNEANTHTFDFGTAGRVFVKNVNLRNDGVVVNHTPGSAGSISLWFDNTNFGSLTFNGLGVQDYFQMMESCWSFGKITIHSANFEIKDSVINDQIDGVAGDISLEFDDVGCENYDTNGYCGIGLIKDTELYFDLSVKNNTYTFLGSTKIYGDVLTNGDNCKLVYDVTSLGKGTTITSTNSSIVELDSEAKHLFYDSSQGYLVAENVQDAIEEILERKIKGVLFVGRNGHDSLGDPTLGSYLNPYASIQAALNRIEENTDNSSTPYVIWVGPGTYPENVLINDNSFTNIVIMGRGDTTIAPPFGITIESNNQNASLGYLEFRGITFNSALNFVGESAGGSTFSDGLKFHECTFNGDITLNNLINVTLNKCELNTSVDITNVENVDFIDTIYTGTGLLNIVTNTTLNYPLGFSESTVNLDNSKIYCEIICDTDSEIITYRGTEIGNEVNQVTISGSLTAINSWLKPSLLVVDNTATFTTQGTFFDKSKLQLDGTFNNETKADVVFYDDSVTNIVANNVQDAIGNLNAKIDAFLVPHGTTFPPNPDGPALFYRTDYSMIFQYNPTLGEWLSTTQMFLDWGANNADGKYLNIHGAVATQTGYLMPFDGKIVSLTAKIASGNLDKSFEVRRNHDYNNPLITVSASAGTYNNPTVNIDFSQGDYIQAYASSVGSPSRDIVVMATIVWRAS